MCDTKCCSKCKVDYNTINNFYVKKNGKISSMCKICSRLKCKEYNQNAKDVISSYNKEYKLKHKEDIKLYNREYNLDNRIVIQQRQTKQQSERRKKDPNFKMAGTLRTRLGKLIRADNKYNSSLVLLGCSVDNLFKWLEFMFQDGMTKLNHGEIWHVDHVIPCARFNLTKQEEQEICFHWTNLQPLFGLDNLSKKDDLTTKMIVDHETKLQEFLENNPQLSQVMKLINIDREKYL